MPYILAELFITLFRRFATRIAAVGVFLIENINHIANFDSEVESLVKPALCPLPEWIAIGTHALTILLGISGALLVCSILLPQPKTLVHSFSFDSRRTPDWLIRGKAVDCIHDYYYIELVDSQIWYLHMGSPR